MASLLIRIDDTKNMWPHMKSTSTRPVALCVEIQPGRPAALARAVGESDAGDQRAASLHRAIPFLAAPDDGLFESCLHRDVQRRVPCARRRRGTPRQQAILRRCRRVLTCVKVAFGNATRMRSRRERLPSQRTCGPIARSGDASAAGDADVPDSHSRPRRPRCRFRRRNAVGRRISRGPSRAGVSELRLGAHGCAGHGVLPHRRQGDPAARAGAAARRADHPGLRRCCIRSICSRACPRAVTSCSIRRRASTSWASADSRAASSKYRLYTLPATRARAEARRPRRCRMRRSSAALPRSPA